MGIDHSILEHELGLPKVGQLGFVVHDIQSSLPVYASLYNLNAWFEPLYARKDFTVNGKAQELEYNIAFAYSGKMQIELVEEKSQGAPVIKEHLDSYGEGMHHLGFYVSDWDGKLSKAAQMGLEVLMEGKFKTAGGGDAQFVYLETRRLCGINIELIHITLYGVNVPQTEFMMNVGKLTGDVRKFNI